MNADDFGLSPGINRGVMESVRRGYVSSVSLCVSGRALDEALALIKENPQLDVGLHIVLVGERPVARPGEIKSLLDNAGNFHKDALVFFRRYLLHRINAQEIEREINAQFQKARAAGINITHVDSHQHLHMLPGIMEITIRMCRRYNVPFIRTCFCPPARHWRSAGKGKIFVQLGLNMLSVLARGKILARGLHSVDFSSGALHSGALNEGLFSAFLSSLKNGVTEIICHPACAEASLPGEYAKAGYGEGEHRFLISDKPGVYIKNNRVVLADFSGIVDGF